MRFQTEHCCSWERREQEAEDIEDEKEHASVVLHFII